jgi:hypothetical protein
MTEKNGLTKLVSDLTKNILHFTYIIFIYILFLPTTPTNEIVATHTNNIYSGII